MRNLISVYFFLFTVLCFSGCNKDDNGGGETGQLTVVNATIGSTSILNAIQPVPGANTIQVFFDAAVAPDYPQAFELRNTTLQQVVDVSYSAADLNRIVKLIAPTPLMEGHDYELSISNQLKGQNGETFSMLKLSFSIKEENLTIQSIIVDSKTLSLTARNDDISLKPEFLVTFSHPLLSSGLDEKVVLVGDKNYPLEEQRINDSTFLLISEDSIVHLTKNNLLFPSSVGELAGRDFATVSYSFFTEIDASPKFPVLEEDALLTLIQEQTFKYFWEFGHPASGLARERNTSGNVVTTGGSGFGLMAMIVAVERGFITRSEALARWTTIFDFLETCDRFHGVWPHWLNGNTGQVQPFSMQDNGGDLVETAFLVQGMLTVRQYLDENIAEEADLIDQINRLWESVEWDWYRQNGQNVLYWHWSPEFEWAINLPIRGHNETQIVYTLAAASPTHSIDKQVYTEGYARSGGMSNGNTYYNYLLPLGSNRGGPLFFTHYSYLGMDPRNLQDEFADYWEQNRNHSLINRAYCIDNPKNYLGYSDHCWGLTASDGDAGYSAHSPNNDRGVITPTAAISSLPYTPEESMAAIEHFYYVLGDRLWGPYGFYDAFNPTEGWVASSFLAIDQGPIICMIENHRTGLLWDLFMSAEEVKQGLDKLDFSY